MALGKAIITVEVRRACSLLPGNEIAVAIVLSPVLRFPCCALP